MPDLIDIVEIIEALETKAVFAAESRCVVVRNRNVICRKCEKACPADVFNIEGNKLQLDAAACVSCGSCTVVCPTEALIPVRPLDEELAGSIADACLAYGGAAVFACARIASKRLVDSELFAEVPCLARIDESMLIELAAKGVDTPVLVDGTCSSCKLRFCNAAIDATVQSANTLIEAMGGRQQVQRQSHFPEDMLTDKVSASYGVSRRDFFSKSGETAKDAAEKTVTTIIKGNKKEKEPTILERLRISKRGSLPLLEARRRMNTLNALDEIGAPQIEYMENRLWGSVQVDAEACRSCGMCANFCPTGALKKLDNMIDEEGNECSYLEFSMAECVQCRTCQDICLGACLTVDAEISLFELFDFEPRIIQIPPPRAKNSIFGHSKR